jgi:hypothetical protein
MTWFRRQPYEVVSAEAGAERAIELFRKVA